MLVWRLVILLKCLAENRLVLNTYNEQKDKRRGKIESNIKHQIYKNKEKKCILCVAGACYTLQGMF